MLLAGGQFSGTKNAFFPCSEGGSAAEPSTRSKQSSVGRGDRSDALSPPLREESWGDGDIFARRAVMRLSVVTFMRPDPEPRGRALGRVVEYARQIEKRGFP